jgi:hypothetical protein
MEFLNSTLCTISAASIGKPPRCINDLALASLIYVNHGVTLRNHPTIRSVRT